MPESTGDVKRSCLIDEELYFLVLRFLEAGPCQAAFQALKAETDRLQLLPKRWDWQGKEHHRSYEDLVSLYRHVAKDHLKQLCLRLGPLLDEKFGSTVPCARSLLGAGNHSLLRKEHSRPTAWGLSSCSVRRHGASQMLPHNVSMPPGLVRAITGREITGAASGGSRSCPPASLYRQVALQARVLGHLSAVYCVGFDRTGKYAFTGADDNLIKIWSTRSGRLLATLRGHSGEIADMAVSFDNSMLATGSCDHTVRVWCLHTTATLAVLRGHSSSVTSLQFCPMNRGDGRYLLSTGADGNVCFWRYVTSSGRRPAFDEKPLKFVEKSRAGMQMLCSSFSPGGVFLATGNTDHVVRMYSLHGPAPSKIGELEAHTDIVDSIQYSNYGTRFVSGSKDGTARIWRHSSGSHWVHIVLPVGTKLPEPASSSVLAPSASCRDNKASLNKLKVTMVCWSLDDRYVMTAVSDYSVKLWDSRSGQLMRVLLGHEDEVYVVEYSPVNPGIMLTAGHDGRVILWDIHKGQTVKTFFNEIQGQGYGAVYDCKFAPDGQSIAATDSHGHLLHFSFTRNEHLEKLPTEMFFHTDYRPLIRDANDYVLDEQTQQPPHLMPPPFLVNIDGVPLAPQYQRLVPGRERCSIAQLVPQMGETASGDREVLDQPVIPEPLAATGEPEVGDGGDAGDQLGARIAALQREQDQRRGSAADLGGGSGAAGDLAPPGGLGLPAGLRRRDRMPSLSSPRIRRNNEVEGVRQAVGNVPRSHRATESELSAKRLRVVVERLDASTLDLSETERTAFTEHEMLEAVSSAKQKQLQAAHEQAGLPYMSLRKKGTGRAQLNHGYRTRAARQQQRQTENEVSSRNRLATRALYDTEDDEDYDGVIEEVVEDNEAENTAMVTGPPSSDEEQWSDGDSSSSSESSDYSDWAPDGQSNLQPPTRLSQRQTRRRQLSTTSDDEKEAGHGGEVPADEQSRAEVEGRSRTSRGKKKASSRAGPSKARRAKNRLPSADGSQEPVHELPEAFRLPDWLTNTLPRRSPYFPQMGDEVIYFRQGHALYLEAVRRTSVYSLNSDKNQPWHKNPQLREQELMKVVGIKYDVKPPRLCCVKLAYMDPVSKRLTGDSVTVKYHDMPDVIDFIVLKQFYDQAVGRDWKVGDRFRAVIDDQWWIGVIRTHEPLSPEFPDSFYQCFVVEWENKETERMSPWDLEPLAARRGTTPSNGVALTVAELQQLQYSPSDSEWPDIGRDEECRRIAQCMERIMEYGVAEPFAAPVDFSVFPLYAMTIGYPIDLSTIKARLDNKFYRRVNAIQFDVRNIESNAREFNEPHAPIVRAAELVTELCLRIIGDIGLTDPRAAYSELVANPRYSCCISTHATTEAVQPTSSASSTTDPESNITDDYHSTTEVWKERCQQLLDVIFECGDSVPFRQPVDPLDYPDYAAIVDCPSDFGTIREQLSCGVYSSPQDFSKDVKQVFINSKAYNTNKRSKIYAMTLRLQAMVDQRMNAIIGGWKNAVTAAAKRSTRSHRQNDASTSEHGRVTAASQRGSTTRSKLAPPRSASSAMHPSLLAVNGDNEDDIVPSAANKLRFRLQPSTSDSRLAGQRTEIGGLAEQLSSSSSIQDRESGSRRQAVLRSGDRRSAAVHSLARTTASATRCHDGLPSTERNSGTSHDAGDGSRAGGCSNSGGGSNRDGQYVTRARTGNLKPRVYSDDALLSDGDSSGGDTPEEPPDGTRIKLRIKKVPARGGVDAAVAHSAEALLSVSSSTTAVGRPPPSRRCPQRTCRVAAEAAAAAVAAADHCDRVNNGIAGVGGAGPDSDDDDNSDPSYASASPAGGKQPLVRGRAAARASQPRGRHKTGKAAAVAASSGDDGDSSSADFEQSASDDDNTFGGSGKEDGETPRSATSASSETGSDADDTAATTAVVADRSMRSGRLEAATTLPTPMRPAARSGRQPSSRKRRRRSSSSESGQSSAGREPEPRAKRRAAAATATADRGNAASDDDDETLPSGSLTSKDSSWMSTSRDSSFAEASVVGTRSSCSRRAGRQKRAPPVDYSEAYNSGSTDDDDGERQFTQSVVTTVSSRGRVRKLTSRARESFAM